MKTSPWLLLATLATACTDDTDPLVGAPCTTNDDCPADQHCEAGKCAAGSGNACERDSDCGPGMVCNIVTSCGASRCSGNTCAPQACTTHDECAADGYVCRQGTCQAPEACDNTGMCLDGLVCNDQNLCVPPSGTCTADDQCTGGTICAGGMCVTPTPCTTSAECPPELNCIQGVCNDPCTMASDCGTPAQFYNCDTATGECQQRCTQDNQCPANFFCDNFLCVPVECTQDSECDQANMEICQGAAEGRGRCVMVVMCGPNGTCPMGTVCNPQNNRCEAVPACRTDRDCPGTAYCDNGFCLPSTDCSTTMCPDGFDCVGNVCVPGVCRGDQDCMMGQICIGGACQMPPSPDTVVEVVIVTPAGFVRPGTTYAFVAIALDQAGRGVPGVTFEWLSSMMAVATIDADGVATGGNSTGVTEIRARVQTANGPVTSDPVELTNLGPTPAMGVRITVVRATNGTPIAGATVEVDGAFGTSSAVTDATGVALFANATGVYDVTVGHASHDYVSVLGVTSTDVILPVPPATRADMVAGIKGTVDLSQVTTEGGLSLSLSGASIASPLLTFDGANLFGGDLITVNVPMVGNIGIPAGNTVEVELMGFMIPLKTEYYARATPGLRSVWTFGGRIGLDNFGGGGFGNLLATILPFFQRFEHGVVPTTQNPLVAIPTIVDTNDFDGDGDTTERIPDWNGFPAQPMQPSVSQSLRYQLAVDNLPFVSGGNANTLVIVAGTLLPSVGFVPLGLDGQSDMGGSGIVSTFTTKMTPPHSGLEAGQYAVLATAVRIDMGLPGPGSARLFVGDAIPTAVDLSDGWLDSPLDATWNGPAREVGLPVLPGADMYRISFASPDGAWNVYGPSAGPTLPIPPPPAGLVDRTMSATITVDAVDLEQGAGVETLFELTRGGNLGVDRSTRGFARAIVGRP